MTKTTRQLLEQYWKICHREFYRATEDLEYTKENVRKYGAKDWAQAVKSNQARVDQWSERITQLDKELK